jgi:hypothetical protein
LKFHRNICRRCSICLSPAEARVAAMIADCRAACGPAEHDPVQLKAVFSKTGTGRQPELVSLLRSPS